MSDLRGRDAWVPWCVLPACVPWCYGLGRVASATDSWLVVDLVVASRCLLVVDLIVTALLAACTGPFAVVTLRSGCLFACAL